MSEAKENLTEEQRRDLGARCRKIARSVALRAASARVVDAAKALRQMDRADTRYEFREAVDSLKKLEAKNV